MSVQPTTSSGSTFATVSTTLWDKLLTVDEKYTKPYTRGTFTGTSISHVHSRMAMTKAFGPHGLGWGFSTSEWEGDENTVICKGTLWYRPHYLDPSYPWEMVCEIVEFGSIGKMMECDDGTLKPTSDIKKGAATDALNRCCMALGHGASIYAGLVPPPPALEPTPPGNVKPPESRPGSNAGVTPPQATSQEKRPGSNASAGQKTPTPPTKPDQPGKQPLAQPLTEAHQILIRQLIDRSPLLRDCETQIVDSTLWFKIKTPTTQKQLKILQEFGFQPKGNGHLYYGVSLHEGQSMH